MVVVFAPRVRTLGTYNPYIRIRSASVAAPVATATTVSLGAKMRGMR